MGFFWEPWSDDAKQRGELDDRPIHEQMLERAAPDALMLRINIDIERTERRRNTYDLPTSTPKEPTE